MIISAYQPYFAPFTGFFKKAARCEILVLMDSVQFPRGTTWLTRNRFKNDHGTLWLTVPVWKKGLGLQRINEVRICHDRSWAKKHMASLRAAYGKAPFFEDHIDFLSIIYSRRFEKLIDLNLELIRYIMTQLKIDAKLVRLSDLGIDIKEPRLSMEICRKLGATCFVAQRGAAKYLDEGKFRKAGIEISFLAFRAPVYPQLWGPYIPNLSVLDLLFNCGPKAQRIIKQ
jgi:hypothetical protein